MVKTVGAVIGGTTKPAVAGPVAPAAAPGVNAIKNPSMETFNAATGLPQCYLAGGYGTNTADLGGHHRRPHRHQRDPTHRVQLHRR